jgi:hypothetical protein
LGREIVDENTLKNEHAINLPHDVVCTVSSVTLAQETATEQNTTQINKGDEANSRNPNPLPKSLRGRWSNPASGHSDLIEIEVLEMSTPRDGKALVTFWPYCRKSETPVIFERKLKVWRFTAANCTGNADQIHMRVRPVEGRTRMEGWYGREGDGRTVYLEWRQ